LQLGGFVFVGRIRLLVADRLGLPLGFDRTVIDAHRQPQQVVSLSGAECPDERRLTDRSEVGHSADADAVQLLERDGADTPQSFDRERVEEVAFLAGADHDDAGTRFDSGGRRVRLRLYRGQLGEELVRSDAHRATQRQLV